MEPRDFLDLGTRLSEESTPAAIRTAVSRLYYANHLVAIARATAAWRYEPRESGDDHGRIIQFMRDRGGRFTGPAGKLRLLRAARAHADYHLTKALGCPYCNTPAEDCEFVRRDVETLVREAVALFGQLSNL